MMTVSLRLTLRIIPYDLFSYLFISLIYHKASSKPERPAKRSRRTVKSAQIIEESDEDVEMEEVDITVRDPPPIP